MTDESGHVIGSLILLLKDGLLSSLEIASWSDPLPLPRFDHVVWDGAHSCRDLAPARVGVLSPILGL